MRRAEVLGPGPALELFPIFQPAAALALQLVACSDPRDRELLLKRQRPPDARKGAALVFLATAVALERHEPAALDLYLARLRRLAELRP